MLSAEHVRARARDGRLELLPLGPKARPAALDLARRYTALLDGAVGLRRAELDERFAAVRVPARYRRLAMGLRKIVTDAIELEPDAPIDPESVRAAVFELASRARSEPRAFDRTDVLARAAETLGATADTVESALYADLRSEHRIFRVPETSAEALLAEYERGQAQAVLLRAERVVVDLGCRSPGAFRQLFARLRFLRLLFTIDRLGETRYRLTIDGPYSLFASVTRYGLQLALVLSALEECDAYRLTADVRWGPSKARLRFETEGGLGSRSADEAPAILRDEVRALLSRFDSADGPWRAEVATDVLHLPGIGLSVPDLRFTRIEDGVVVYLEVLGFWSRESVFRRIDLVRAGLGASILFAVPERLRVSEALLDDHDDAALYVWKGVMHRGAIEEKLAALADGRRDGSTA